jgi:hypothetical protein
MWMEVVFIWIVTGVRRAVMLVMLSVCTSPVLLGSHCYTLPSLRHI